MAPTILNKKKTPLSHDNLSKPELAEYGPSLIQQKDNFCDCSKIDFKTVLFSLKCISDLLCKQKYMKLRKSNRTRLKVVLNPYKNKLLKLATPSKRVGIAKKMRSQTGGGIISGLVLALIPLVSSLVSKLINKKK